MSVVAAQRPAEHSLEEHAHVDETAVVALLLAARRGPEHVMVDVGALRGSSAIHFARLAWTVHCFEPHAASRAALSARFAGQPNIHVDARAVGEASAVNVPLYQSEESDGITTLKPFRPSHVECARVDVTTIAEIADERGLASVDFLKIDVEGLDLAVLAGVPWERLRPDVIECEFEDAKTLRLGHSWRDIGRLLRSHEYAVYVSEWHPIVRYGERHDWRRIVPFAEDLELDPRAWGNFLAFRDDPGLTTIRQAFDEVLESELRPLTQASRSLANRPGLSSSASEPRASRRITSRLGGWLRAHAPVLYRVLRTVGRGR